jgi:hypothetical protein
MRSAGEHDLRLVLDDHQRIAGVAQPLHHADHAFHIARMQADRRLVEHEQGVDERRAERGREVDALDFAARQRARLAVERQVTEPDLGQIGEPRADFGQQQVGCLIQLDWKVQIVDEVLRPVDRQQHQIVHRESRQRAQDLVVVAHGVRAIALRGRQHAVGVGLGAEPPRERVRLEARAAARFARRIGAIFRQEHANMHLVRLAFEPFEEAPHAIPGAGPGFFPAHPLRLAFEHPRFLLRREVAPWRIERDAALGRIFKNVVLAFVKAGRLPRPHCAAAQRFGFVGHDQPEVDADDAPESATRVAGAKRRIEREQAGRRLAVMDVAIGAMQVG